MFTYVHRKLKTLLKLDDHLSKIDRNDETNVDQKLIETVFFILIFHQSGNKWQSKTLFLMNFDLHSSIVLTFLIAAYPVCYWKKPTICAMYQYTNHVTPDPD